MGIIDEIDGVDDGAANGHSNMEAHASESGGSGDSNGRPKIVLKFTIPVNNAARTTSNKKEKEKKVLSRPTTRQTDLNDNSALPRGSATRHRKRNEGGSKVSNSNKSLRVGERSITVSLRLRFRTAKLRMRMRIYWKFPTISLSTGLRASSAWSRS